MMCRYFYLLIVLVFFSPSVAGQRAPVSVFAQTVQQQVMVERIEALGTLRADEATVLSASVTETVTVIHFNDNQRVKAGEVLLEMTSAEEHAQLEQAMSRLDEVERQFARLQSLVKNNLTTESQLDQQRAAVEAAAAQLRGVQSRLQDRLIIAPFDGVVGLRNISVGALVRPGDVITTLDDDRTMKLDMTVPSLHLAGMSVDMAISAKVAALGGRTFTGTLASIDSRVDPITRSITARALIPNPERLLRPGLLATVELSSLPREVVAIAEEAIVQIGRQSQVYVLRSSQNSTTVEQRVVVLGRRQPGFVEIVEGLQVGEQVVVHGAMKLRPGAEVSVEALLAPGQRLPDVLSR